MIEIAKNIKLVECGADLPNMAHATELFLDFETTSFDPAEKAFQPYKNHRICGTAVTRDDDPTAYYIPVRHHRLNGEYMPSQVPEETFQRWLHDSVTTCKAWVNHNVKFDAHFATVDGAVFTGELIDTIIIAQLMDSDRMYRGGYGLDVLSRDILKHDINKLEDGVKEALRRIKLPRNKKAQDYGLVPIEVMAPYAGQDVLTARELYRWQMANMPPELRGVWRTERMLTPVLYDMEHDGLRIDPDQLDREELIALHQMLLIEQRLQELTGSSYNPASSDDCYSLLVNQLGLPVLEYNDDGNPSFDKAALKAYLVHPLVATDERKLTIVTSVGDYRKLHTYLSLFVTKYKELHADRRLHPQYRQAIKSFRMASKTPNAQQLNPRAKRLIHCDPDEAFFFPDYSQIEYRLMMHYLRNEKSIDAYRANPDTDFHQWVADMCGIPRKPAKNVNFAIGYGAGKTKVTNMLAADITLMGKVIHTVDEMIARGQIDESQRKITFDAMCKTRAGEVYNSYHDALPSLKPVSRQVATICRMRGFVFDAYDRRYHIHPDHTHNAFNRLIQGCAASLMKERTVAISPRYCDVTRRLGIRLGWSVHDETGTRGPIEVMKRPDVQAWIIAALENVSRFSVPIRATGGYSETTWGDETKVEVDRTLAAQVGPLPPEVKG
jgi:DNA polymerase I-like protein with 3'-5' exonuclease and polymerase domains